MILLLSAPVLQMKARQKMSTRREIIILKAVDIIKFNPDGIRYSDLKNRLRSEFPDFPVNTIHGVIWNLDARVPEKIYKPVRGLYRHTLFR
jgi:hypothetical protein